MTENSSDIENVDSLDKIQRQFSEFIRREKKKKHFYTIGQLAKIFILTAKKFEIDASEYEYLIEKYGGFKPREGDIKKIDLEILEEKLINRFVNIFPKKAKKIQIVEELTQIAEQTTTDAKEYFNKIKKSEDDNFEGLEELQAIIEEDENIKKGIYSIPKKDIISKRSSESLPDNSRIPNQPSLVNHHHHTTPSISSIISKQSSQQQNKKNKQKTITKYNLKKEFNNDSVSKLTKGDPDLIKLISMLGNEIAPSNDNKHKILSLKELAYKNPKPFDSNLTK